MTIIESVAIDWQTLNLRTGSDQRLLAKLANIFVDYYPDRIKQLESAIRDVDDQLLAATARHFKDVLRDFCASSAIATIERIEDSARARQLNNCEWEIRCLHREIELMIEAIQSCKIGVSAMTFTQAQPSSSSSVPSSSPSSPPESSSVEPL